MKQGETQAGGDGRSAGSRPPKKWLVRMADRWARHNNRLESSHGAENISTRRVPIFISAGSRNRHFIYGRPRRRNVETAPASFSISDVRLPRRLLTIAAYAAESVEEKRSRRISAAALRDAPRPLPSERCHFMS